MSNDSSSGDQGALPDEIDEGLAFAYGKDSAQSTSHSVIGRIGEITGSKPQVLLRDDSAGDAPMLKPVGSKNRNVALPTSLAAIVFITPLAGRT